MSELLTRSTVTNIGYNTVAKIIAFAFQGLANIILSQNLGASDYGIVGFAMIFANFLGRFNDLGIQTAVVQRKNLDDRTLYTAFTVKAVLGLLTYAITFVVAGFSPYFFDNPAVITVIRLISLNFIINTFAFLPRVLLIRDLDFKKLSISEVLLSITSSLIAVVMALNGFKYWSIVVATLASNIVAVIVVARFRPVKLKLVFDKEIALELVRFGGNLFLSGMIVFLLFNADNFVVGSTAGSAALGYYALAFNWGSLICMVLGDVVHSVLFPTFSKIQGDTDRIKSAYLKVLEVVGFVAVFVNLVLFLGADEFLYYMLGKGTDKWFPALATLRIICCYGIVRALLEPLGSVIMAIGKTELLLKANFLAAALELILLYPVIKLFGIFGVGVLITLAYFTQYLVFWPAVRSSLTINAKEVLTETMPFVFPAVVIGSLFMIMRGYVVPMIGIIAIPVGVVLFIVISGILSGWKLVHQVRGLFLKNG